MPVAQDEADLHACDDHAWLADLHAMRQAMIHVGDLGSAVLGIAVELKFLIAVGRESQLLAETAASDRLLIGSTKLNDKFRAPSSAIWPSSVDPLPQVTCSKW